MIAELAPLLLVLAGLLVVSGIASGSETALFSLSFDDRAELRAKGRGAAVESLLASPRRLLLLVLILNMTINVAYFAVASLVSSRLGGLWAAASGVTAVLAVVLFGEVLAKLLARTHNRAAAALLAPPMLALQTLIGVPLRLIDLLVLAPLTRVIAPGASAPDPATPDELASLVEATSDRFTPDQRKALARVLGLGGVRARAVMTPRVDLDWVDASADVAGVRDALSHARHHLLPVCDGGLDAGIVGILDAKRYLAAADRKPAEAPPLSRYVRKPLFVPEQARLDQVLERFRQAGRSLAICVDETGDVAGLIEIEDVIDEILRGLAENTPGMADEVVLVGLDRWALPGRLGLHEFCDLFAPRIGEDLRRATVESAASTVGGFLADCLGRVPAAGDTVQIGSATIEVEAMDGRAVRSAQIWFEEAPA
ncbi:MAG: CNNM domain-containing protein [Planctomycetota bacterium]